MSLLLEVLWDFPGRKGSERPREMAFELRADGLWGIGFQAEKGQERKAWDRGDMPAGSHCG